MSKKRFYSSNVYFFIDIVFLLVWPITSLIIYLSSNVGIWIFICSPFVPMGLFIFGAGKHIRFVLINDGHIYTPRDLCVIPIQYKVYLSINDIVAIKYKIAYTNSRGVDWIMNLYPKPSQFLFLKLNDGSIERICVCGFTKKTLRKMQALLLEINPRIKVLNDPKALSYWFYDINK